MRKTFYILLILAYQVTFSQVEKAETSLLNENIFENKLNKNSFTGKKTPLNLFPEIINLELKDIKNNSEGKFSLNDNHKKYFIVEKNETSIFDKNKEVKKTEISKNLSTNVKKEFVNTVIRKKIAEEIEKYMQINEALTYGDRNMEFYKNYIDLENKLIISTPITPKVEAQIGKDIYPFLNKILKTELDKTLQNSLNLFVINF
ncbi:hypothetical protein [Polaribacter sp. R77954]|uniref:hypothetical protein n=1 Tax=Polaribacter sp. R77954 TaxID=3093870 RepID=UPI0037CB64A3